MNSLDQILQERGILKAARRMQWQTDGKGWSYPAAWDAEGNVLTRRWKNADPEASAGNKYLWKPNKPAGVKYYHAPENILCQAIALAGGLLYIANGEPSVLAYHAARIANVLSWFGENAIPSTLVADLLALGVTRVIYAPDKDSAGVKSAARVRDILAGSGIHFEALALPDALPEKADFNDLWIYCRFDRTTARAMLDNLPALDLPAPAPAPVILPRARGNSQGQGRLDRERLKTDVFARLMNTYHWKKSGQGYAGRVPWREDKQSSGGITLRTGTLTDFATGEQWQLVELAQRIGINPDDYRDTPPPTRAALGLPRTLPNSPRQTAPVAAPCCLPDSVILEIATTFTPGTAMLTRLADELNAAGKLPPFCRADLFRRIQAAGYPMNINTFNTAYRWFVELNCQKSHTNKKEDLPYDFFDILPHQERIARLKTAIMTRLIKASFPESDFAAALPAFTARMLTDTLNPGEDTAAIAEMLNQTVPLPERSRERSDSLYKDCEKKYHAIARALTDNSVTRLEPADLPAKARSNPNAYLDVLRLERMKRHNGQQMTGKQRSAAIGIHDPRQRARKLKLLGIICHAVKLHREIDTIAAIDQEARRNCAHPLRIVAVSRAGDETAALSVDNTRAAEFVTRQRAAGYRVYVELQAASRIEVSTPPEREVVNRQPDLLQFTSKNQPVPVKSPAPEERSHEIPGRYTDHWLKFHILRRLKRDERGFYTNLATGETIPNDLIGSLAELIEALTGYRLTQREEQTA